MYMFNAKHLPLITEQSVDRMVVHPDAQTPLCGILDIVGGGRFKVLVSHHVILYVSSHGEW